MNQCSQTRINRGFSLIVDDSGHRKSGNFTAGVGRQYIGEIGKTDNGIVVVTTHLYDGKKNLLLDIELYQHSSSLAEGKKDPESKKNPELALGLIDRSLSRGYRPGIVLIDAGYGNNTSFLLSLEKRRRKYLGELGKNRQVIIAQSGKIKEKIRLDNLAQSLPDHAFTPIQLNVENTKTVWVATIEVELSQLEGTRTIAIVINASTFQNASDVDYFITNVDGSTATAEWIVTTYSQRNWVEVFYREALMMVRVV
jgi:DDE superfamily endonuclease